MCLMKELWENKGYADLKLTSQNLRDQAARLEKTLGDVSKTLNERIGSKENAESQPDENFEQDTNILVNEQSLHNSSLLLVNDQRDGPLGEERTMDNQTRELMDSTMDIFATVSARDGLFTSREIDTRTKEKITKKDTETINNVVYKMLEEKTTSPIERPFEYLWMVSCILYSAVVAFLLSKGWKKYPTDRPRVVQDKDTKEKEKYQKEAGAIRREISIAKAELERLQENRKISKKGKKNRESLRKNCKTISATSLISYIEKKKSELRKLKKVFYRRKKQREARTINKQFQLDPGRVYDSFREMASKEMDEGVLPVYQKPSVPINDEENRNVFTDIDEASKYWRELWEARGSGNCTAEWLKDVEEAVNAKVPPPTNESVYTLTTEQVAKTIRKKKNWSAPGPDRIANYWWKRIDVLHEGVAKAFETIMKGQLEYPQWFSAGKTSLIPKPGAFTSDNQRPITCLNTVYKWFTSCLLEPIDDHLGQYNLMELEQRGARKGCSGTMDNLLIDRMVTMDCHRRRRNLSMSWIDVKKAYDSVSHEWLNEMMKMHRFPLWLNDVIKRLVACWNTRICVKTKRGYEESEMIKFNKGLPQGDALCPRLFTLCLNPVAWLLKSTEGYRLSKPLKTKVTHLLYIDDLKIFASTESKMNTVLRSIVSAMKDIGLHVNPKKCSTVTVKRGARAHEDGDVRIDENTVLRRMKEDENYKFLGVLESVKQEEDLALKNASTVFLQRMSVIWTSPLSDYNRVLATNQFALTAMAYQMWTQHWSITELRKVDREARKIIVNNGGKHPKSSNALLYLPREEGGRGLRSVETEYKITKVKAAVKLYNNDDPMMETVRNFEELAVGKGHSSLLTDAKRVTEEYDITINLVYPEPGGITREGDRIKYDKIGEVMKKAEIERLEKEVKDEKWQGKLTKQRWEDEHLSRKNCFQWMKEWRAGPTHVVAGMCELYEQMLPTKLYYNNKTKTSTTSNVTCRLCGKGQESVAHVLAKCSALAQNKYLMRHNNALKVLYFELLRDLELIDSVPPWYSPTKPKPEYDAGGVVAQWDIPTYGENQEMKANRIDAKIVNHNTKEVIVLEMSCPWIDNREKKDEEKTAKYGPLRWELKERYPGYKVSQYNIIMDALGGWSTSMEDNLRRLLGSKTSEVLRRMQLSVISSTLNIARTFKVVT